jgi:hypothetical protein
MHRLLMGLLALFVTILLAAGCGGTKSSGGGTTATTHTFDGQAVGKALLDRWSAQLVSDLLVQRDRARASQAGNDAKAARLESTARRQLSRIQKFGAQARAAFLSHLATPEARTLRTDGDAWTKWAYTLLTEPPAGDFAKAQKIADLAAKAVRAHQVAYQAVGAEAPAAFQTRR